VSYDDGRVSYTPLGGAGTELAVGISSSDLSFLPTFMGKLSQRSFKVRRARAPGPPLLALPTPLRWTRPGLTSLHRTRLGAALLAPDASAPAQRSAPARQRPPLRRLQVVNGSSVPLKWAVVGQASPTDEALHATSALAALESLGGGVPALTSTIGRSSLVAGDTWGLQLDSEQGHDDDSAAAGSGGGGHGPGLGAEASVASTTMSAAEEAAEALLADAALAAARQRKRARRDLAAASALLASPHFAVFPPEGEVWPGSEVEVIVQFSPECAAEYEELAFVELQGRSERQALLMRGKGLGAVACFSFDTLDVGQAFVHTHYDYEVELQNRQADRHTPLGQGVLGGGGVQRGERESEVACDRRSAR